MKICPKCKTEHEKSGIYCSRSCANSRVFTDKARKKKSNTNKKYWESLSNEEKEHKALLIQNRSPYQPEKYAKSIMTQDWDVLGIESKRLRTILEQDGHCNKCGINEWNGEIITLEYEHKDGDNTNNTRSNVEALCPNCHSQTPTWRGRKSNKKQKRVEKYLKINAPIV